MQAIIGSQLRVERRRKHRPLTHGHDPIGRVAGGVGPADRRQDFYLGTRCFDPGSADEHRWERRFPQDWHGHIALEGLDLPPERVAAHSQAEAPELPLIGPGVKEFVGQHDHPGAGAESRHAGGDPFRYRIEHAQVDRQAGHGRRLAAGDDERPDRGQLSRRAHGHSGDIKRLQLAHVLAECPLQRQDPDGGVGGHQPRSAKR